MSEITHTFDTSLSSSWSASELPLWNECYRQFFGKDMIMVDHRENGEWQKAGIDRSIVLSNSKQVLIDEKIRWKAYDDIALEEWSKENLVPGWITKPLRCDYIAYAIAPLGKCYLLNTIQLQKAWRKHGEEWKRKYFKISAINYYGQYNEYTTVSWAVPVNTLMASIAEACVANFEPVLK